MTGAAQGMIQPPARKAARATAESATASPTSAAAPCPIERTCAKRRPARSGTSRTTAQASGVGRPRTKSRDRIVSSIVACRNTPGSVALKGPVTRSPTPVALAPIRTIRSRKLAGSRSGWAPIAIWP